MTIDFPGDWIEPWDLFVSYCREDNRQQQVTAIATEIENGHADFAPTQPLKVFFDQTAIVTGELWQNKLQKGIRQSKVLLAVLSKAYFESPWCRREYEEFLAVERSRTYPGEAMMPVYVLAPQELHQHVSATARQWFDDLNQKNGIELQEFWPMGQSFLQEQQVRQRLQALRTRAVQRAEYGRILAKVPRRIGARNSRFVGRIQEIRRLRNLLTQYEIAAVCAVQGIGGIGKSSLSREYAYCFRPEYLGGQFEIDLSTIHTPQALEEEIILLARSRLGAVINEQWPHARQLTAARDAFARTGMQQRILLILDNLNEDDVALVSAGSLDRSLPSAESTDIIVTTRAGAKELGGIQAVTVERLSAQEALDVLLQYREFARDTERPDYQLAVNDQLDPAELEAGIGDDEWKAALAIVNRLGRHTLAVAMVGAYLGVRRSISLATFLSEIKHHGIGLALDHVGNDKAVKQLISHPQTLIGDLFRTTLEWLNQQSPLPLRTLQWASLLPPETIPVGWLQQLVFSEDDTSGLLQRPAFGGDPWLECLETLGGLQLLTGGDSRRMHRVLQEVIARQMTADDRDLRQEQIDSLIQDRAFSIDDRQHLTTTDHHQLSAMVSYIRRRPINRSLALARRAMVGPLMNEGRLGQAVDAATIATGFLEAMAHDDPENAAAQRDLSVSYERLGSVCVAQGDLAGAKRYFEQSRDIRQRLAADPENAAAQRDLSVSYSKLGDVCVAQGDLAGAKRYFEQSRDIRQRLAADPENAAAQRDLSVSYERLGSVCVAQGDLAGAKRYFEQSRDIRQRLAADPENAAAQRDLSVSYSNLGDVCVAQGDLAGAKRYFEQSRDIRQRLAADPENAAAQRDLSVSYSNLGDVCVAQGDLAGAKRYFEQSRDILQRLAADPENAAAQRDLSVSYERLGSVCVAQGDLAGAKRYFEQSSDILQRLAADPENAAAQRDLSVSYERLGSVCVAQGDLAGAKRYFEQSRDIRQRLAADPENAAAQRDLSVSYSNLGDVCVAQGDLAGAKRYFEQSSDILQRLAADPENAAAQRDLSVSYSNLGDVCVAQGDLAGAKRYFEQSRDIRQRLAADPENAAAQRDLSVSYSNLGDVCVAQGDLAGAKRYFEQSRDIRQRLAADPENAAAQRDLSVSYERLGSVCVAQGDLAGAKRYFEQSRDIRQRLAADPENAAAQRDLCVSLERLAKVAQQEGDTTGAVQLLQQELRIAEGLLTESPGWAEMMRFVAIVHLQLGQALLQTDQQAAFDHIIQCARLLLDMESRGLHLSPGDRQLLDQLRPLLPGSDHSESAE